MQKKEIRNESGQAILEYIILLLLVVSITGLIANRIVEGLDRGTLAFGGRFEKQLKSGRLDPSVWGN